MKPISHNLVDIGTKKRTSSSMWLIGNNWQRLILFIKIILKLMLS